MSGESVTPNPDQPPAGSRTGGRLVAVEKTARKTLTDVRIVLGLAAFFAITLPGGGWLALAQIQSTAREENKPLTARVEIVEAKQAATDASVVEANRRSAAVERTVMVIDLNMRLMLESRGIKPIDVPPATPGDAGGK